MVALTVERLAEDQRVGGSNPPHTIAALLREKHAWSRGEAQACKACLQRFDSACVFMVNDKRWIRYTPIVTTSFFQLATFGQIYQMVTQHTSAGQNPVSWLLGCISLGLWLNWYRVMTPDHKIPWYTALAGLIVNTIGLLVVLWFRSSG